MPRLIQVGSTCQRTDCACTRRIESGGTFTDIYAEVPDVQRPTRVLKLLSVDPRHYDSAPLEGIRRILEEVTGEADVLQLFAAPVPKKAAPSTTAADAATAAQGGAAGATGGA